MSATGRRRGGGAPDLGAWIVPILAVVYAAAWAVCYAGLWLAGDPIDPPDNNLIGLPIYAATGQMQASTMAAVWSGLVGALLLVGLTILFVTLARGRKPNRHIDAAAVHMARGKELARFTRAEAAGVANRLGCQTDVPGVFIGHTVAGKRELWADWESTEVNIWGPRTGKTTSRAVEAVLNAPGAVVATTNRRDLVDLTRGVRELTGEVRVFDPQQIIGEPPAFAWDPLSYVMAGPQGSEVKAQQLAGIFASAMAPPDSKADRFFDPKGQTLLGHLIHAAALDGLGLAKVYAWVNAEDDTEPARILDRHGFVPSGDYVRGIIGSPDKQRGGIYATAELCITWMTNRAAVEWVTPSITRPAFDPAGFAHTADTLYLVSREGRGTLAPLTTALTAAVCEAAEHQATMSHGGRLPVPMVVCLDEVANVCRWPDLPDLYSHYGGRGIYLLAILQSWRQGEDTWGARGMSKLWSASTVRIYGGGDTEVQFLDELRRLAGTYRPQQVSSGHSHSGRSVNYSEGSDDILDVADLAALPRGRAILIGSGARPVLIAPRPWQRGPWKGEVELSRAKYAPAPTVRVPQVNPEPDVLPAGAAFRSLPGTTS